MARLKVFAGKTMLFSGNYMGFMDFIRDTSDLPPVLTIEGKLPGRGDLGSMSVNTADMRGYIQTTFQRK